MSFLAHLCTRRRTPLALYETGIRLVNGQRTMLACGALWSEAAAAFVRAHDLGALAAVIAPEECYPYPGEYADCAESWLPPQEISAAAARYASALRNLSPEEREALRQGLYDWDRGDAPLLGDEDLDAMLLDLREAMEDLSLQARRIAELGDDLMLLLLA